MSRLAPFLYRLHQDFLMGDRLDRYRSLLRRLRALGYRFSTMSDYVAAAERHDGKDRVCLLRNDVDTDPAGAARMAECDREEGVRASYFFRRSTLNPALARQIAAQGGEVGYHYEEISAAAQRLGLFRREQVDANIEAIRADFRGNFARFGARTGMAPRIVAAHGDFLNRRLGISNRLLLTPALRMELGIVADAYDPVLHDDLAARFSDRAAPVWWWPADPMEALAARPTTVSILVHPRQWVSTPLQNARVAAGRAGQEVSWRIRAARILLTSRSR